jgi:hypothetical protein
VRQLVDAECRAYGDLGAAANAHAADKLRRLAEQHAQLFTQVGGPVGAPRGPAPALRRARRARRHPPPLPAAHLRSMALS